MNLQVGQVLYVVLNKQTAVYPMQVVEEITKKTLDGVVVDYIIRGGGPDSKTPSIRLGDIDGEVFETWELARKTLTGRVVDMIEKRISAAVAKAKEWYPTAFSAAQPQPPTLKARRMQSDDETPLPDEPEALVDLGNGMKARLKLPENFME
jgi:hypothetical protein